MKLWPTFPEPFQNKDVKYEVTFVHIKYDFCKRIMWYLVQRSLYLQWWTAPCLIDSWFRTERFGCQRATLHKSISALLHKCISSEGVRIFLSMYYITRVFLKARFQWNLQQGSVEWHYSAVHCNSPKIPNAESAIWGCTCLSMLSVINYLYFGKKIYNKIARFANSFIRC